MQNLLKCIAICKQLKQMDHQLVVFFNKHTSLYDGDALFATATSSICKHWVPRAPEISEDLFMNYNCNHPNADFDFGDTDHCCIMACPDEEHGEEIAGQIAKIHSDLHPLEMDALNMFNSNSHLCKYHSTKHCLKCDKHCCMANCPL